MGSLFIQPARPDCDDAAFVAAIVQPDSLLLKALVAKCVEALEQMAQLHEPDCELAEALRFAGPRTEQADSGRPSATRTPLH